MKALSRFPAVLVALALASACGGGGGSSYSPTSPSTPGTTTTTTTTTPGVGEVIATNSSTFNPGSITVAKGSTVSFIFQASEHNVTFANVTGAPANIANTTNATVQRVFATAGSFGFQCTLHSGMNGTVVVN